MIEITWDETVRQAQYRYLSGGTTGTVSSSAIIELPSGTSSIDQGATSVSKAIANITPQYFVPLLEVPNFALANTCPRWKGFVSTNNIVLNE